MKIIMMLIKKIVLALFMLYSINIIINNFGIIIPINIYTIIIVSILGIPSIFGFLFLKTVIL